MDYQVGREVLERQGCTESEIERIMWRNAADLYKLPYDAPDRVTVMVATPAPSPPLNTGEEKEKAPIVSSSTMVSVAEPRPMTAGSSPAVGVPGGLVGRLPGFGQRRGIGAMAQSGWSRKSALLGLTISGSIQIPNLTPLLSASFTR